MSNFKFIIILFLSLFLTPVLAAEESGLQSRQLAQQLLADVPQNSKIALRLFDTKETGIPTDIADRLYDDIYNALFKTSAGRHVFVERKNLAALLQSQAEFYESNPQALLEAAKADIEIICDPTPGATDRLILTCSSADVRAAITLGRAQASLPIALKGDRALPLPIAITNIAERLTGQLQDIKAVNVAVIRDQNHGVQTDLGALLGEMLIPAIENLSSDNYKSAYTKYDRDKELTDTARKPAPLDQAYRLEGTIWHLDNTSIQLQIKLLQDGVLKATTYTFITKSSLPDGAIADNSLNEKIYTAIGEAIVSEKMDYESALRAAKNLARARVVAQAVGLKSPAVKRIISEADAAHAITETLVQGIPVEERFLILDSATIKEMVRVELHARVLPLGDVIAPDITAKLSKPVYKSMEPIFLKISSSAQAYIGVFAWGADNQVVRLYPNHLNADLIVDPRNPLLLPHKEEGQMMSMPLPFTGNMEDHEAIIVIAATSSQPFENIAKMAGENLAQTMKLSKSDSRFFEALGKLDLSRMSMHVLPYQVTN